MPLLICISLELDPHAHGLQTTKDGKFSVEFVECLAGCGTAPVMMCNEDFQASANAARTVGSRKTSSGLSG